MKIYKKDDKIICEIPFWSKRYNPYMVDDEGNPEDIGEYPTLTGLIVRHRKGGSDWEEIGFAHTIDMDYKDKGDQVGSFVIMWYGDEEDFIKKCKEFGIGVQEIDD